MQLIDSTNQSLERESSCIPFGLWQALDSPVGHYGLHRGICGVPDEVIHRGPGAA